MFNALTFDEKILLRAGSVNCSRVFFVGKKGIMSDKVVNFLIADNGVPDLGSNDGVFLPSLLDNDVTDAVTERVLSEKRPLMLSLCNTLDEVGTCDKRYGVTPVGLAHKLGLLDNAFVSGCVYLDKDDIDLIVQSGAKVILTPSDSMGSGHGIPPLRMLINLGALVYIGSGSGKYNAEADIGLEKRLLTLAVSGALCTPDAVPEEVLDAMADVPPEP